MKRITLEEAAWEVYSASRSTGKNLLDYFEVKDRDFIKRAWGIFPYRSHSFRMLGEAYKIAKSTAYRKYRGLLRRIKSKGL